MRKKDLSECPNAVEGGVFFRTASFLLYHLAAAPFSFIIGHLIYGLRVKGRKYFRGHKNGMIAANHCQFMEPAFSGLALWPRKVFFSAEENNIVRRDVGWLVRLVRAFGIPDKNPLSVGTLVTKALKKNWFVHFYPEGVLYWRSQEPAPFMEGVFFFAYLNNVPVFPLAEVLKDRPIRRIIPWWPPRTLFVFCPPVYPEEFRKKGLSRREIIHQMSEAVRKAILDTIQKEGGCTTLKDRRTPPAS